MDYYFINCNLNVIGVVGMFIIIVAYFTWTYNPPKIFLFKDPISNKYGINAHTH